MAVKGLLEGWFGGRLGVWGPRTPKLPRAPRNGDPALLRAHEKTHLGVTPFTWEFCKASFSQKSNLRRHITVNNNR